MDTYSDIYVNGFLVKSTDNMFLTYDVKAQWEMGENQVVVHIKPAMLEARKNVAPAFCMHQRYNRASLYTRKAPHMYGWDIMPRIVSAGIWKKVTLRENKTDSIRDVYLATLNTVPDSDNPDYGKACLRCYVYVKLSGSFAQSYRIKVEGHLRGFSQTEFFVKEEQLWHNTDSFLITLDHCRLWWPGNYGSPALYDVTVTLYCSEEVCDQKHLNLGVRTAELRKTSYTDEDCCLP